MLEILGWVGSILFAICGIPLLREVYKQGHAKHYSQSFLLLWFFGEVLTLTYVIILKNYPLIFNYFTNAICLIGVLYYKFKPRREK